MKSGSPICFKFVGIGDAGARVMRRMIQADIKDIDLIAVHADEQAVLREQYLFYPLML